MLAQFGAKIAAVCSVSGKFINEKYRVLAVMSVTASALSGCMPASVPLLAADPADPAVPVPAVGYRSTVAPYESMRPVSPSRWRQQNDSVAPASKSGE